MQVPASAKLPVTRADPSILLGAYDHTLNNASITFLGHGSFGVIVSAVSNDNTRTFKICKKRAEITATLAIQSILPLNVIGFTGFARFDLWCVAELNVSSSAIWLDVLIERGLARASHVQLCFDALATLHTAGFMHNDVKPESFVVTDGRVQLTNLSACAPANRPCTQGTLGFMHPRTVLNISSNRTSTTDLYAMAITTVVVLSRCRVSEIVFYPVEEFDQQLDACSAARTMVVWAQTNQLAEYPQQMLGRLIDALQRDNRLTFPDFRRL